MTRRIPPPNRADLERLYVTDRQTAAAIAQHFGVSVPLVYKWLATFDIPRRPAGTGLVARGITPPTREELRHMVWDEHLSYVEIGKRLNVDPANIGLWLKKHDIPRPTMWQTRRKGAQITLPTEAEIRDLQGQGLSLEAIGNRFGVSERPIRRLCTEYGIPPTDPGYGGWRICTDGHRVRSGYEQQVDEWLTEHGITHVYEPHLPPDHRYHADFLANGWYIEIWGMHKFPRYKQRQVYKQELYRLHELPLIEIPGWTFDKEPRHWQKRLARCAVPHSLDYSPLVRASPP